MPKKALIALCAAGLFTFFGASQSANAQYGYSSCYVPRTVPTYGYRSHYAPYPSSYRYRSPGISISRSSYYPGTIQTHRHVYHHGHYHQHPSWNRYPAYRNPGLYAVPRNGISFRIGF